MSIIQDALKKVQGGAETRQSPPRSPVEIRPDKPEVSSLPVAKIKRPAPALGRGAGLAIILAITLVIIGVVAVKYYLSNASVRTVAPLPPDDNVKNPAFHQEVTYKPIAAPPEINREGAAAEAVKQASAQSVESTIPDLVLNGIMYLEAGPRAIINNSIVGEGDTISGAQVTRISKRNVVLIYNNVEVTLNLK